MRIPVEPMIAPPGRVLLTVGSGPPDGVGNYGVRIRYHASNEVIGPGNIITGANTGVYITGESDVVNNQVTQNQTINETNIYLRNTNRYYYREPVFYSGYRWQPL